MPVTIAQVQASIFHGTQVQHLTLDHVFPLPSQRPFLREEALVMLKVGLQLGEVWHGDPANGVLPILEPDHYIAGIAALQVQRTKDAIAGVEPKAPGAVALPQKKEDALWNGWGGADMMHNARPSVVLMFNSASAEEAFRYVGSVCQRMLIASASLGTVSIKLFVGWRDWRSASVTSWHRAKTLLAAQEYEILIHQHHDRRQASVGLSAPPSTHGSPGHMASLTHRQARRSRVSEEQLRRRWA